MMWPSSSRTVISEGRARSSLPFGPSTLTWPGSRDRNRQLTYARQLTPLALPDIAEHLATESLAERLATAHDALGCAQNRDPQPTENPWDLGLASVHAQSGAADPLHARNHARAIRAGLEDDTHRLGGAVGFDLVAGDIALVLQDSSDLQLELGRRHAHLRMSRAVGVAHAREHVGDGIADDPGRRPLHDLGRGRGAGHHQLDFVTPGMRPSAASCRKQIRHMPNLRRKARGRPQMRQRLCNRTLNFGCTRSRFQRSIDDFFAKLFTSFV